MMELEILNGVHDMFHGVVWLNYTMKYISALAAGGTTDYTIVLPENADSWLNTAASELADFIYVFDTPSSDIAAM